MNNCELTVDNLTQSLDRLLFTNFIKKFVKIKYPISYKISLQSFEEMLESNLIQIKNLFINISREQIHTDFISLSDYIYRVIFFNF